MTNDEQLARRRSLDIQYFSVNFSDVSGHGLGGETLGVALESILAELSVVELVAVDDFFDRVGQLADAGWLDEQPVLAMHDRLGNALDMAGNNRHSGGHGFEDDHWQAFAKQAWQDHEVYLL